MDSIMCWNYITILDQENLNLDNMASNNKLRLTVACHDVNGFWNSPIRMRFISDENFDKKWEEIKDITKEFIRDDDDKRELLVDQLLGDDDDLGESIVIPSKCSEMFQRYFLGQSYDRFKIDIFEVTPMSEAEMREIVEKEGNIEQYK
jgi:hypothetical protein